MTKALTLHQPWASLVALGVKTIETRSWSTPYRGRLLIHAGRTYDHAADEPGIALNQAIRQAPRSPTGIDIPLGAIVASCTLADVAPMVELMPLDRSAVLHLAFSGHMVLMGADPNASRQVDDQRPYGDFAPGRFAWLLEDVKPTTERCPACWGEGVGAVCPSSDGERGCDGSGRCEPVPARGRQRLWGWAP